MSLFQDRYDSMNGRVAIRLPFRDLYDLATALQIHVIACGWDIKRHKYPELYKAGVRYKREPWLDAAHSRRTEDWLTPTDVIAAGGSDCEDLASWRASELRLRGENAWSVPKQIVPGLIHIVVLRGNGTIEDPSKILGM